MRRILWLAFAVFLVAAGVPVRSHAQPAPAAAPPATAAPPSMPAPAAAPGNPGTGPLLATHQDYGLDCVSCHEEEPAAKPVLMPVCLSCHGTYDELADKSDEIGGAHNPHAAHTGPVDCGKCHRLHARSVDYCAECHSFSEDVP